MSSVPAQPFAYVTDWDSRVSVIDTATNSVVATISVEGNPVGVAITPDGAFAYVAHLTNEVSVINTATNAVIATIPAEEGVNGRFEVAITPDGAFAYVINLFSNNVSVIATATHSVVATIPVGQSPVDVAITPDGAFAYVTNISSSNVSVINTATNAVVATVPVGFGHLDVAIIPAPPVLTVGIDIKPGNLPNSVNPRSQGKIPVAILSTPTFDATAVDPTTVHFGATGIEAVPVHFALEDVDRDGDMDMILHFNTQSTGLVCGATSASLTAKTLSGQAIEGADTVKTTGCT